MHKGLRNAVLAVMPVQHSLKPDAQALGLLAALQEEPADRQDAVQKQGGDRP